MADALGGEIDSETYELSYIAGASEVSEALETASTDLGAVSVTRTISGILHHPEHVKNQQGYHQIFYTVQNKLEML